MIALHGSRLFSAAMGPRGPERRQGCARHQRWISHDKHLASSVLSMCVLYARDTVYLHVLPIFKSQLRILSAVPTMESVCAAMPTYLLHPSSRSFPRTNGPSDQANELALMQRVLRLAAVANESCAAGCCDESGQKSQPWRASIPKGEPVTRRSQARQVDRQGDARGWAYCMFQSRHAVA
jgi:hypothetical protein